MTRTSHGMILGEDGTKMSKSRGNVINPDDIVEEFGADTLRVFEMFVGDFEKVAPWSTKGVRGARRFLERVWSLRDLVDKNQKGYSKELETKIHQTIKKVSNDYENLKANTAIAALMELLNEFNAKGKISLDDFLTYLLLLNPVAPHITEELYHEYSGDYLNKQAWPKYSEEKCLESTIELPVQFNGKVKFLVKIKRDEDKSEVEKIVKNNESFKSNLGDKNIVKEIYVPGKIYNIVVK